MIGLVMKAGETAVNTMALLDEANTKTYGHPEITDVNLGVREQSRNSNFRTRSERHGRIAETDRRKRSGCIHAW